CVYLCCRLAQNRAVYTRAANHWHLVWPFPSWDNWAAKVTSVSSGIGEAARPNQRTPTADSVWRTRMRLPSSRGFKKATGNRRGQSLIEFSLAAPLLLMIATGMVWFGFALYEQ